jgi:ankyrin repeat protein
LQRAPEKDMAETGSLSGISSIIAADVATRDTPAQRTVSEMVCCIEQGDLDRIRALVGQGFDLNTDLSQRNQFAFPAALHMAVHQCKVEVVKLLIELGANVNLQLRLGENKFYDRHTPLHCVSTVGESAAVCRLLLDHGADPTVKTNDGNTQLHLQLWSRVLDRDGLTDICRWLIEGGVDPNAVSHGFDRGVGIRQEVSQKLGIPNNAKSMWTPLHLAILCFHGLNELRGGDLEGLQDRKVVELLLRYGADPSFVPAGAPQHYLTPLQMAAKLGTKGYFQTFLASDKADIAQKTLAGRSLIQLSAKNPEIKALIMSAKTVREVESVFSGQEDAGVRKGGHPKVGLAL